MPTPIKLTGIQGDTEKGLRTFPELPLSLPPTRLFSACSTHVSACCHSECCVKKQADLCIHAGLRAHMNDHPHMDLTDKPRKMKAKRGSSTFSSLRRSVGDRFPLSWLPPATGPLLRELSVVWPSSICRKVMGDGVRQTMKRKGPPHFVKGPYACYRLTIDCFCALSVERGAGEKSSDPEKHDFASGSSSWGSAGSAFDEDSGGAELVDEGVAILFVRSEVQDEIAQQKTSKWKDCETISLKVINSNPIHLVFRIDHGRTTKHSTK